ncbi:MAG: sigma-70 family RNA polymerase sigma factor [Streptomyces sp.]|nr:sigma-70 family RNA polymerase sigma factor [Streptomyces sp.]
MEVCSCLCAPDPYVYRIMSNTRASWWRRRWWGEATTGELPDSAHAPDTAVEIGTQDALRAAMTALPVKQRIVIVLRYFEDPTDEEIAVIVGCPVSTVRSQASRALARLGLDPAANAAATETGS